MLQEVKEFQSEAKKRVIILMLKLRVSRSLVFAGQPPV
jgi:hypothetical protein